MQDRHLRKANEVNLPANFHELKFSQHECGSFIAKYVKLKRMKHCVCLLNKGYGRCGVKLFL